MNDGPHPPRIDLVRIRFPTDSITIGDIKRVEPHVFADWECKHWDSQTRAVGTRLWEHALADQAFCRALGMAPVTLKSSRALILDVLGEGYRAYGLSSGEFEDEELARSIETQAIAQAMEYMRGRAGP